MLMLRFLKDYKKSSKNLNEIMDFYNKLVILFVMNNLL